MICSRSHSAQNAACANHGDGELHAGVYKGGASGVYHTPCVQGRSKWGVPYLRADARPGEELIGRGGGGQQDGIMDHATRRDDRYEQHGEHLPY